MSTTYDLCCPELKLKVWIGQSSMSNPFYLYSEEINTMVRLEAFLLLTEGKRLVFASDHCQDEEVMDCVEYWGDKE